jgi:ParB-like chromosome segregation protein Spo0J
VPKNADPDPDPTVIPAVPIQRMRVAELLGQKAAWNPRRISVHDLAQLEKSLLAFGCVEPIVWNRRTKTVVGGHQRLELLGRYGVKTTPVSVVDLDPARERVLNVALNRTGGEFDDEKLRALVDGLTTSDPELLDGLGFTDDELRAIEAGALGLDDLEAATTAPAKDPPAAEPALPPSEDGRPRCPVCHHPISASLAKALDANAGKGRRPS